MVTTGTGDHANLFALKIRTGVGGETYVVKVPMDHYYVLDGSEKLAAFLKRKCEVWAGGW